MSINEILGSMLKKTIDSQSMNNISQQNKDMIKNIMNQSLDMALEQLSPRKINQIVLNELRKKQQQEKNSK